MLGLQEANTMLKVEQKFSYKFIFTPLRTLSRILELTKVWVLWDFVLTGTSQWPRPGGQAPSSPSYENSLHSLVRAS